MRLYLDACIIIYLVEGVKPFVEHVESAFTSIGVDDETIFVTSQFSLIECRTLPIRDKDEELLEQYGEFFGADGFRLIEVDDDVIETATQLRAAYNFKTPDAIHLATAIHSQATCFLTGDVALRRCSEVSVRLIGEDAPSEIEGVEASVNPTELK